MLYSYMWLSDWNRTLVTDLTSSSFSSRDTDSTNHMGGLVWSSAVETKTPFERPQAGGTLIVVFHPLELLALFLEGSKAQETHTKEGNHTAQEGELFRIISASPTVAAPLPQCKRRKYTCQTVGTTAGNQGPQRLLASNAVPKKQVFDF